MQVLHQGAKNFIVKVHEAEVINLAAVPGTDFYGKVKGLTIDEVWYDLGSATDVALQWEATTNEPILTLSGNGQVSFDSFGGMSLPSPPPAGATGSIAVVGTGTFTIIIKMHKNY